MNIATRLSVIICLSAFAFGRFTSRQRRWFERQGEASKLMHECRACSKPDFLPANCPSKGFDCSVDLPLSSNRLRLGCFPKCSRLKCADSNATLAVNGKLVGKVICDSREWRIYKSKKTTRSVACARKCGKDICPAMTYPIDDSHSSFDIKAPDYSHHCAWALCPWGAEMSNRFMSMTTGNSPITFLCGGDRIWTDDRNKKWTDIKCLRKPQDAKVCEELEYSMEGPMCKNHRCYRPLMIDNGLSGGKKMSCDEEEALRITETQENAIAICAAGQWSNTLTSRVLPGNIKVTCIDCPPLPVKSTDKYQPYWEKDLAELSCSKAVPTVLYSVSQGEYIPIEDGSIFCDKTFEWDSTGMDFGDGKSLKEKIVSASIDGFDWIVRCVDACFEKPDGPMGRLQCVSRYVVCKDGFREIGYCPGEQLFDLNSGICMDNCV